MLKNIFKIRIPIRAIHRSTECNRHAPGRFGALAFSKYLLIMNTISSGALMSLGDLFQQEIEYNKNLLPKRYDYGRLTRMFIVGLGFGPLNHYFYEWVARLIPARNVAATTKKMIIDQCTMSPLSIAIFFYSMGIMESKSIPECTKELKMKFVHVYLMDFIVCFPSQFINFYYVPVKYQVIYVNIVAVVYSMCLSYFKHNNTNNESNTKSVNK